MSEVTKIHEERETLAVDVNLPGHDPRTTTALFRRTRQQLIDREGGRCAICGRTQEETGHPLEAHHHPVERSLATAWDWPHFIADCMAGKWGPSAQHFDWEGFMDGATMQQFDGYQMLVPVDPYKFVDDMTVNGELLCKAHHIGKDEGKHAMPYPLYIWQRYAPEGYPMSGVEIIHHDQE